MSAQAEFDSLMEEAEAAAWRKSHSMTGKITTSAFYTARKAVVTSPSKGASFLASHVPIVGPLLSFGVEKLSAKIRRKRIAAAVFKQQIAAETTTSGAKALMKNLADLATKLDGNMTKQEAAFRELNTAMTRLDAVCRVPTTTAQAWTQAFWNAAYAYFRVDHYNVKLAELVDDAQEHLARASKYTEGCTDDLVRGKEDLWKTFEGAYNAVIGEDFPLLGRGRSSSSFRG